MLNVTAAFTELCTLYLLAVEATQAAIERNFADYDAKAEQATLNYTTALKLYSILTGNDIKTIQVYVKETVRA